MGAGDIQQGVRSTIILIIIPVPAEETTTSSAFLAFRTHLLLVLADELYGVIAGESPDALGQVL